jgi:hypothetical protein
MTLTVEQRALAQASAFIRFSEAMKADIRQRTEKVNRPALRRVQLLLSD